MVRWRIRHDLGRSHRLLDGQEQGDLREPEEYPARPPGGAGILNALRYHLTKKPGKPVAIVSYDEKPGIQAIATTAPDLPPVPGAYATLARDYEYKRHGTLSLLAGIDLLAGKVHALVRDRHRSREFVEFLKLLDAAYPASTAIRLILDNHSAHISRETRAWLDTRPT